MEGERRGEWMGGSGEWDDGREVGWGGREGGMMG